jgi:hypothetical protein
VITVKEDRNTLTEPIVDDQTNIDKSVVSVRQNQLQTMLTYSQSRNLPPGKKTAAKKMYQLY